MRTNWNGWNLHVRRSNEKDLWHKGEIQETVVEGDKIIFKTAVHGNFTFNLENTDEVCSNQYRSYDGSIAVLLPPSSV